jgi:hypothetical protein
MKFSLDLFLRKAPAGNHQIRAEDLVENVMYVLLGAKVLPLYSHRLPPTLGVEELKFVHECYCNVKKELNPLQ